MAKIDKKLIAFNKCIGWLGIVIFFIFTLVTLFITHQELTSGELMLFILAVGLLYAQVITGGYYN